jgi:hypothetical protein
MIKQFLKPHEIAINKSITPSISKLPTDMESIRTRLAIELAKLDVNTFMNKNVWLIPLDSESGHKLKECYLRRM